MAPFSFNVYGKGSKIYQQIFILHIREFRNFFGWEALIFQSLRSSDIRVNTGRVFYAKD